MGGLDLEAESEGEHRGSDGVTTDSLPTPPGSVVPNDRDLGSAVVHAIFVVGG
jgi:hypothetical protein